jgi:hypothetical protein
MLATHNKRYDAARLVDEGSPYRITHARLRDLMFSYETGAHEPGKAQASFGRALFRCFFDCAEKHYYPVEQAICSPSI